MKEQAANKILLIAVVAIITSVIGVGTLPTIRSVSLIPSAMAAFSDQGCSKSDFFNKDFHGPHSGFNRNCFLSDPRFGFQFYPSSHGKSIPDCKSVSSNPNADPGNFKCKHFGPGSALESASISCKEGTHIDTSTTPWRCVPN